MTLVLGIVSRVGGARFGDWPARSARNDHTGLGAAAGCIAVTTTVVLNEVVPGVAPASRPRLRGEAAGADAEPVGAEEDTDHDA